MIITLRSILTSHRKNRQSRSPSSESRFNFDIYIDFDIYRKMTSLHPTNKTIAFNSPQDSRAANLLSEKAIKFLEVLHRTFDGRRRDLLQRRAARQSELNQGGTLDFLPETKNIRDNVAWKGAKPAPGLKDRRVEITGPTDRKMVVNALNSDVWTYMADFEGKLCEPMMEQAALTAEKTLLLRHGTT